MTQEQGLFPKVDPVIVNPDEMDAYESEWQFLALSSGLLKEAASYVCIAACTTGRSPAWDRNQAVVGGNMVRLYKVLSAFLDQTVQKRAETSTILSRLAFETIVNARYLIVNFTPELIESYIRHSLRHERRLLDSINANIGGRGGDVQPIEQRMLNSLNRTAEIAGIMLDDVDLKDRAPWGGKNLREKAKALDLDGAYMAVFSGMSHNVHGNWQDLYQFHLETDGNGGFTPALDWGRPRPQPLFALGILTLDAVRDFLEFIGGEAAIGQVRDQLDDLRARLYTADHAHETYLVGKAWPKI